VNGNINSGPSGVLPLLAAFLTLVGAFFWFQQQLINAYPLQEIQVRAKKFPEVPLRTRVCMYRYPKISDTGAFINCRR